MNVVDGYIGNMDLTEFNATPYFSYVNNFIDADRCSTSVGCPPQPTTGFNYLQYANHDARLWGADVSGRAQLYKDKTLGEFATHTSMSYARGERMDGGNLYHMMPFNMKLSLDVGLDNVLDKQYYHSLAGSYLGDRFGMSPSSTTQVPWGRNVPGMGRSAFVGITIKY